MSTHQIPYPPDFDVNYHADRQQQRVERARKLIDPGDVISVVESRLSAEADVTQHPLYQLTLFLLDRATAVDGAKLYNDWRRVVLMAIDSLTDDALELED
jgi:hypothetical protein